MLIIWVPVLQHYHVPNISVSDTVIEKARHEPEDSILNELNSNEFRALGVDYRWDNEEELIEKAESILQGNIPGFSEVIKMPFNADDVSRGLPGEQVKLAGLYVPDLLVSAYQVTRKEEYFSAARENILAWASYERQLLLPQGMIWNDYAIAARNEVLIRFWTLYRKHKSYNSEVAKVILQFIARGGEFLAKPSHFTYSSNHGIIQNAALLRLYLAFPTFPDLALYKQMALQRLDDQMKFYINDEGVVLEHSAHYQHFGVHLVGMIIRSLTLMNEPIPEEWKNKYERAKDYYAQIRRLDGSLPMYGDTHRPGKSQGLPVTYLDDDGRSSALEYRKDWIPKHENMVYPVAGYSTSWDGLDNWPDQHKINQTLVAWSYFPGQAHKHADEMSVLLYAGGQTWWTNAGYWTFGTKGRSEAVSWGGSNAPHLVGESYDSVRSTGLKYYGWAENLSVIDLQRNGPGEYAARRQVIHIKPNLWLIVDATSGDKKSRTTTTWTTLNDVVINDGKLPGSYDLRGENKNASLSALFITSDDSKIKRYRGSYSPFAGWVKNKPAEAIVIEQPANNSWSASIWSLENAGSSTLQYAGVPYMQNWNSPESWAIVLPVHSSDLSIGREGNKIYVNEEKEPHNIQELTLERAPAGISDKYTAIRAGYENAAMKHSKFKDFLYYRWKMTYFLIFVLILQELFFIIYKKRKGMHYPGLRILAMISWIVIIVMWEIAVYLKG